MPSVFYSSNFKSNPEERPDATDSSVCSFEFKVTLSKYNLYTVIIYIQLNSPFLDVQRSEFWQLCNHYYSQHIEYFHCARAAL